MERRIHHHTSATVHQLFILPHYILKNILADILQTNNESHDYRTPYTKYFLTVYSDLKFIIKNTFFLI